MHGCMQSTVIYSVDAWMHAKLGSMQSNMDAWLSNILMHGCMQSSLSNILRQRERDKCSKSQVWKNKNFDTRSVTLLN